MPVRHSFGGLLLMAVPLYAGPLLSGWSRAPWGVPAVLAILFFLAQVMAGRTAARRGMPLPLYLIVLALTQIVVVFAVHAAGMGLAMLTGALDLGVWLPLLLTGLGAAILILRHPVAPDGAPDQAEVIGLLDQALDSIDTGDRTDAPDQPEPPDPEVAAAVDRAVAALWALPADARNGELDEIVATLEAETGPRAFPALLAEIGEGAPQVDRAMLHYLLSPVVRYRLVATKADLPFAFDLLLQSTDAAVQADLAALIETLLAEAAPATALPRVDQLRHRAETFAVLAPLVAPVERIRTAAQAPDAPTDPAA